MGEWKSSLPACFLQSSLEAVPKCCIRPIYTWTAREADPKELGEESAYEPHGIWPIYEIAQSPFPPLSFLSFFVSASSVRF